MLLAFDFLFFCKVSFESHWLETRDDKASYLPEHSSSPGLRRVTGGDVIHSTLLRKDLCGFSLQIFRPTLIPPWGEGSGTLDHSGSFHGLSTSQASMSFRSPDQPEEPDFQRTHK